jgi:hypothetical protein
MFQAKKSGLWVMTSTSASNVVRVEGGLGKVPSTNPYKECPLRMGIMVDFYNR